MMNTVTLTRQQIILQRQALTNALRAVEAAEVTLHKAKGSLALSVANLKLYLDKMDGADVTDENAA